MKNRLFTLSRQNQKGQVAIFVALIFQVIFVFFAVLINVGLLVHHKINLQQSTDLAAYYGAMKQAELMNAIAHVNFQMRQAWKLLTWRYRIVGTFASQQSKAPGRNPITFPLSLDFNKNNTTAFMGASAENHKCPGLNVGILDVPFFCGGHSGFANWPAENENNCRLDCEHIANYASSIERIPLTGGYDNAYTGGVAGAVNGALDQANQKIADLCNDLGPSGFASLAKFIVSYGEEIQRKKKLVQMLGADLSADVNRSRDISGGLIKDGATKTFENNLTEANLTGKISFSTLNGLNQGGSSCPFKGDAQDGKDTTGQFLAEIKFQAVQFFIHQCQGTQNSAKEFVPASIYKDMTFQDLTDSLVTLLSSADRENIRKAVVGTEFIIGYEKNPWCEVYYAAKAQSEPKIPFLPMAKIRLSAVSVAKPFGGTIGPRYNAIWPQSSPISSGGIKVDETLPARTFNGVPSGPPLVQFQFLLPNYANYVGDKKGLKDAYVVGAYQDILLHRQISENLSALHISQSKESVESVEARGLPRAVTWPSLKNWNSLSDPNSANYDYVAQRADGGGNSFLRDLEISVLAPNQFDLAYYSIDPDFYNNYYVKLKGGNAGPLTYSSSLESLKSAAGGHGPDISEVSPDYGYNAALQSSSAIANNYSVRHQIAVASRIIKETRQMAVGAGRTNKDILRFIPDKASSLLTGWTFQDFSHYVDATGNHFPKEGPDNQNTMTFGKCNDQDWNNTNDTGIERSFDSPVSRNLPPTPGNCVWGGRTGYSVKIVTPGLVRSTAPPQDYGGGGGNGILLNPIDENFFTF